jgi:hypothetical protein
MTVEAGEAPAVEDATGEVLAVLGEKRIKALHLLAKARQLEAEADSLLIGADLSDAAREILADLEKTQAARDAAAEAITPVREVVDRLRAELADCEQRAGNAATVINDDMDLTARIEARSLKAAFAEETAALTDRIRVIEREALSPLQQDLAAAHAAERLVNGEAADIMAAAEDPFTHPRARQTSGWAMRMSRRWGEVLLTGDEHDPGWKDARVSLMAALRASGIGEAIEKQAIEAYRAGDPAALAVGGNTHRWPDGTTLVSQPGQPPVVSQGTATRGQLASLPPAPHVDTTPAGALLQAAWAGFAHQSLPGLPGVHHPTEPQYGRPVNKTP